MSDKLRNIALIAHGGAGKTSLAEAMLFKAGVTTRQGRVEEGNTVMDYDPEEVKRQTSISTGLAQAPWKKHTITILDTPGDQNFFTDTKICMQAADGAVVVVDGVDGVKVQTEIGWEFAADYSLPCAIFLNKMERERADFQRVVDDIKKSFESPKPIIVQLPIGEEADFKGVIDLVSMKAHIYDAAGKPTVGEIPADLQETAAMEREAMIENVVEADDVLMEKYLEGTALSDDEVKVTLRKGILSRAFAPILCGSAVRSIGVDMLMDFIVNCMPSPMDIAPRKGVSAADGKEVERSPDPNAPFSGFVFKTVADPYAGRLSLFRVVSGTLGGDGTFYNATKEAKERYNQLLSIMGKEQKPVNDAGPGSILAVAKLKETTTGDTLCADNAKIKFKMASPIQTLITFALVPKSKGDEDKILTSLNRLLEEDQGLKVDRNAETKEILLSGAGQVHIESTVEKLKRKFNVEVLLKSPKVPYRETIKKKIRVQGRHKKQTGGHGQFGDCWIQLEPQPRGKGFEFVDAIVGGVIPRQYIPAVEKGVIESAIRGVLAGFPTVDFRVTLDDGSYHAVDSSEMAFKIAGSLAFRKAAEQANPVLLEPIMKVRVTTPDEFMGDIMGDLNGRRGRVLGMENAGKYQVINAEVPMSEFLTYAPDLRSMTGGRGIFTMEFERYDEVPSQIAEKLLVELKAQQEAN
ncbi:MAG: elongation factor G [Desulfobacteraceae bacterium]|nr:elongation factor G [Desulfobacteraceae bacterium]